MSYKPIGVSMNTKLLNAIDSAMPKVDAISRSQFICKAVEYYLAALNVKDISNILSPAVESSIRASVRLKGWRSTAARGWEARDRKSVV